jgi:hypothetical protein
VLRIVRGTETTQENNQDWLELDEGDLGFQLLKKEEIATVIFLYLFSSEPSMLLNFPFICFICVSSSLGLPFASLIRVIVNLDNTPPPSGCSS